MNKLEKKILSTIDQMLPVFVIILVSAVGFFIRISLLGVTSEDAHYFLLPWFDTISQNGLYEPVGNYNFPYQLLIWIMTKIPLFPLFSFKLLSCIFDYLLAIIAALLIKQVDGQNKQWNSIGTYAAVLLCPVVFLNSAAWAQCDVIFSVFAILGLYFLEKERYNCALISLGMSFAFKMQAVFILPVFLFVYFTRRKFSFLRFILIPLTFLLTSSPIMLWGRNLLDTFSVYYGQTSTYPYMSMNYPSFWMILCKPDVTSQYHNLKIAAIFFTICILAAIMIVWIREQYRSTGKNLIIMAFMLMYTCVLFLPAMHERYSYPYEICGIILAILIPRTVPLCIGVLIISLRTYGAYLFDTTINLAALSYVNVGLYLTYFYILKMELQKNRSNTVGEITCTKE